MQGGCDSRRFRRPPIRSNVPSIPESLTSALSLVRTSNVRCISCFLFSKSSNVQKLVLNKDIYKYWFCGHPKGRTLWVDRYLVSQQLPTPRNKTRRLCNIIQDTHPKSTQHRSCRLAAYLLTGESRPTTGLCPWAYLESLSSSSSGLSANPWFSAIPISNRSAHC